MRYAVAIVALCGCNQIFDLRSTDLVDYVPVDAPALDAASTCPPAGTPPSFSRNLTQAFSQRCTDYSMSYAGRIALAICFFPDRELAEGRVDDLLAPARGFAPPADSFLSQPRIMPEGDSALVQITDTVALTTRYSVYARDAAGIWALAYDTDLPSAPYISQPSRGPAHRVLTVSSSPMSMTEWELAGSTSRLVASYTAADLADLGVTIIAYPELSADGLRMTAYGQLGTTPGYRVIYLDRASTSYRFGMATNLAGVPSVSSAILTDDCSRLYFTALYSLFYQEQAR